MKAMEYERRKLPYSLDHKMHQDFRRQIYRNNILFTFEAQIHKFLLKKMAV
jgi:hypothetical protein